MSNQIVGKVDGSTTTTNVSAWHTIPNYKTQNSQGANSDMVQSNTITEIAGALLRAQRNMGAAVKDAKNPFFKSTFANLNSVREASHPALNAEGIVVLQPTLSKDGKSFVRTLLLHTSGEYLGSDTEVVTAKQNDPQAYGSAISYARRYGLQSLLSLGTADDDGEAAMSRTSTKDAQTDTTKATVKSNGSFKKAQAPADKSLDSWD